jgi:hypothetical protein
MTQKPFPRLFQARSALLLASAGCLTMRNDTTVYRQESGDHKKCTGRTLRTDQYRVKNIKQTLGIRAIGRKVVEVGEAVQLREPQVFYPANYDLENDDIEVEDTNLYNIYR